LTRSTNTVGIDLSGYTLLSSFNTLSTTVSGKENALTFTTPLTRSTNTIGIDLSGYVLKTTFDTSINAINTSLNNKQNTLTFTTPLNKDGRPTRLSEVLGSKGFEYPKGVHVVVKGTNSKGKVVGVLPKEEEENIRFILQNFCTVNIEVFFTQQTHQNKFVLLVNLVSSH
jgi:hypothetical protein